MVATDPKPTEDIVATERSVDLRTRIPKLGLREYWYPAILDREVGAKKPVFRKMLGQDLCLFRGKSGQVVALANACPHRGAMLAKGDCVFQGFVTCFYHGFTFDERGECVAAIGEGPESPMPGQLRARVYPTTTHKGVVFAWMGEGEPAPLAESIPEEFFDPDALVFNWWNEWACPWRPALENADDAHFRYLHRNSVRLLMQPIAPPAFPPKGRPTRIGKHRLRAGIQGGNNPAGMSSRGLLEEKRPYQDYYPGLDAKWPQHRWRLLWTWMFTWAEKRRRLRPYELSEEWGPGHHLPSMFRQNYWTHVYTRWVVPVEENYSRIFYFHAAKPPTELGRVWERLHFRFIHNWLVHKNFSEQDSAGSIDAYHDTPEYMAPTDGQVVAWRKMLLTARGVESGEPSENGQR
jgi:phenylpropionate dioxygenase-like ring-hydroxylating dioxygenase large terminal subunit